MQGQQVHVVGMPAGWGRELPGVILGGEGAGGAKQVGGDMKKGEQAEKMKIAWRYERLGQFGEASRGGIPAVFVRVPLYILMNLNWFLAQDRDVGLWLCND